MQATQLLEQNTKEGKILAPIAVALYSLSDLGMLCLLTPFTQKESKKTGASLK